MGKFHEETLTFFTSPASDSEELKLDRAKRMIKDAIDNHEDFEGKKIEVFGQGSYENNTNVRVNSDIDVNVMYNSVFFFQLPEGRKREDFGLNILSNYTFEQYKNSVEEALVNKFGRTSIDRAGKNKCITVIGNSSRVEADAVPTFKFRRYQNDGSFIEGVKFRSDSGDWIINFPKQHTENGIIKNNDTKKRFKRLVRIHKRLRYKMQDDGVLFPDSITSFLLECLVWNVPNDIFLQDNIGWEGILKDSIAHIYTQTQDFALYNNMTEVSNCLYLFRSDRKWTADDVADYLQTLWAYLEF